MTSRLSEFVKRGGQYIDYTDSFNKLKINKENDTFYPVCNDGQTRSQILSLILVKMNLKTELPHGTGVGNDIYYNTDDYKHFFPLSPSRYLRYNPEHRRFLEVFKTHFVARAGENHILCEDIELFGDDFGAFAGRYLPDAAKYMKQWFTDNYYTVPQENKRKIFLCCMESAVSVIERLLHTHANLNGFIIVRLPFETVSSSQLLESYALCERSLNVLFQ